MHGQLTTTAVADAALHTYTSPVDGWSVNTHILEGPEGLAIFDGQLLSEYAEEAAEIAAALGKPVERLVVSHAHPDHWAGLAVLAERFPDAAVWALPGVIETIAAAGDVMLGGLRQRLGERVAATTTVPTKRLDTGPQEIAGVPVELREYRDAESDVQLVVRFPQGDAVLVFDLLFAAGDHAFVVAPTFGHWAAVLQELGVDAHATIVVGHGPPTDATALTATLEYLGGAEAAYAGSDDAAAYSNAVKASFPAREQPQRADFSGARLYAAR